MVAVPIFLKEIQRFPRALGDRFLFGNRRVADILLKSGAVMGHPDVCSALMEGGQDILVFPGGSYEAVKPVSERYELLWQDRLGFVKLAAKHGYTVMPFGLVGPEEFYGHLTEGRDLLESPLGRILTQLGILNEGTRTDFTAAPGREPPGAPCLSHSAVTWALASPSIYRNARESGLRRSGCTRYGKKLPARSNTSSRICC
ncbi:MAG: hypothetical protein R3E50_00615 [Halioglobus sp.]